MNSVKKMMDTQSLHTDFDSFEKWLMMIATILSRRTARTNKDVVLINSLALFLFE